MARQSPEVVAVPEAGRRRRARDLSSLLSSHHTSNGPRHNQVRFALNEVVS